MKRRRTWQEKTIGAELPPVLRQVAWKQVSGGDQEYGEDPCGNDWRREGSQLWTTLASEYREAVHLPVFLNVNKNGVITSIEIEAYFSYGPSHGRPAYGSPQKREEDQVGRLIKSL